MYLYYRSCFGIKVIEELFRSMYDGCDLEVYEVIVGIREYICRLICLFRYYDVVCVWFKRNWVVIEVSEWS